ncbi:unnamed protein product, partial [Rotaria sp. Silwood2]
NWIWANLKSYRPPSFRIEFRPASFYNKNNNKHLWESRMNIDPITWFDLKWCECGDNEEFQRKCLAKARSYIKKYRTSIPEQMPIKPLEKAIIGPQYCDYQLSCKKGGYDGHPKHTRIICDTTAEGQRDDGNRPCGQYIMDEYIVMEWPAASIMELFPKQTNDSMEIEAEKNFNFEKSNFIFTTKKETIRDILIFLMPPWHLSNRELIQLPLFWATIILTIEAIALNSGQWETDGSNDKRLIDCHGHAHLLLNLTFINACDDTLFRALEGRVINPANYLKQNAQLLHFERLKNHEFDSKQTDDFSKRL